MTKKQEEWDEKEVEKLVDKNKIALDDLKKNFAALIKLLEDSLKVKKISPTSGFVGGENMELNKIDSEKYMEIVRSGNIDAMFDFGQNLARQKLIEEIREEIKIGLGDSYHNYQQAIKNVEDYLSALSKKYE